MPKTSLDVVGRGYRSIGYGHQCPACYDNDTYYSSYEYAWVCLNCGEVFPTPEGPPVSRVKIRPHTVHTDNTDNTEIITRSFSALRDKLKKRSSA